MYKLITKKKKEFNVVKSDDFILSYISSTSKPETINLIMCRICYNKKGDVPIFHNTIQLNIPEEIFNFSGVTVTEMDNFPQNMCQSCLDLLNGCIMFRDMCQKTNREMVELSIKKESSNIDDSKHEGDDYVKIINCDFNGPSSESDTDVYKCATCHTEFTNFKAYKGHLTRCKKSPKLPKRNKDQVHDKLLKVSKKPPRRRRKVVNTQSFLCDTCGKTSPSKRNLEMHIATHGNIFPFKCDVCPYRGRTVELLKIHKRSHLADKPYKCTQCPKTTTTASNLARHVAHVHSTVKPFKCSYCDREFANQLTLNVHKKYNHLAGPVECEICYNKYQSRRSLRAHLIRVHKQKRQSHCRLPSYLLVQNDTLPAPSDGREEGHSGAKSEDDIP